MKAITRSEYGSPLNVLELKDVEMPVIKHDEVLVRVHAASVNAGDVAQVRGTPYIIRPVYGMRRPKRAVIGMDVAGTVERVGDRVARFSPGDEVFGGGVGTFAEYAAAPEKRLALKPDSLSFDDAAVLPVAGLTALQGIRGAAGVVERHKVLINGASGGVGTFAVQIAKALGAEVTAVCSTRNVQQARSIGADHVIDYTKDDFTKGVERYDVVFDNAASHSLADTRKVLTDKGVLIPNAGLLDSKWLASVPRMLGAVLSSVLSRKRAKIAAQGWSPDDLTALGDLIEVRKVTPIIDRTYPLAEAAQAVAYVGEGHARGKVVIAV
jgi:NADPH:quinone reductase-like Zn-dependent oxidoreductase